MAVTTAQVYKSVADALVAQLLVTLPGKVYRGAPLDRVGNEFIAVGGIEEGLNEWAVMRAGRKPTNGSFKLIVNVTVHRGGNSPEAAEERALDLYQMVEELVADDPRLGLTVPSLRILVSDYELDSFQGGEYNGWTCMMVVKLLAEFRRT